MGCFVQRGRGSVDAVRPVVSVWSECSGASVVSGASVGAGRSGAPFIFSVDLWVVA